MNAPPLIRSLRRAAQVHMPTARCAWQQAMRPAQYRFQSSLATTEPPKETSVPKKAVSDPNTTSDDEGRIPRAVQALYMAPLRREVEYGVPAADLQLRSYSNRGLALFCDFALRAAYYLGLPAFGPVPLPRITERWTVPRSHFIFKKSQENYERVTMRRLIQIRDGNPETVQIWLAFLKKHAYPGIGMKANMWEFEELGVGKRMDAASGELEKLIEPEWSHLGVGKVAATSMKRLAAQRALNVQGRTESYAEEVERIKEELVSSRQKYSGGR